MSTNIPNEQQPGEGFAFFRFHVLTYPWSACWGFRDTRPGMGYCMDGWRRLKRNNPALKETP